MARRAVRWVDRLAGVAVLLACAPVLAAYGPWHDWPVPSRPVSAGV